jgi:hypothetical protein
VKQKKGALVAPFFVASEEWFLDWWVVLFNQGRNIMLNPDAVEIFYTYHAWNNILLPAAHFQSLCVQQVFGLNTSGIVDPWLPRTAGLQ